jgi:hypothetical protein
LPQQCAICCRGKMMGFAALYPSYGLDRQQADEIRLGRGFTGSQGISAVWGEKQTSQILAFIPAFDPKRTLGNRNCHRRRPSHSLLSAISWNC